MRRYDELDDKMLYERKLGRIGRPPSPPEPNISPHDEDYDHSPRMARPRSPPETYISPDDEDNDHSPRRLSIERKQSCKVLCVSAIPDRASDEFIKKTLYREYKRFGDFSIHISHDLGERVAYVCFRTAKDTREAKREKSPIKLYDKVALIEPVYESVKPKYKYRPRSPTSEQMYYPPPTHRRHLPIDPYYYVPKHHYYPPLMRPPLIHRPPWHHEYMPRGPHPIHQGMLPPPHHHYAPRYMIPRHVAAPHENRKDKFPNYLHHIDPTDDPMATRTLFVGNLEITVTEEELRRIFSKYGICEKIDIKRPLPGLRNTFAFVRFQNLDMAYRAKVELSGQQIGKYHCKIGYGKSIPTTRVWIGGLGSWTSLHQLEKELDRFGTIKKIEYNKGDTCAYITYETIDAAHKAVKEMRGFALGGPERRLRIEFADSTNGQSSNSNVIGSPRYENVPGCGHEYEEPHTHFEGEYRRKGSPTLEYEPHTARRSAARGPSFDRSRSPSLRRRLSLDSNSSFKRTRIFEKCRTFKEIVQKSLSQWSGALILKDSLFPVKFHFTDGNPHIFDGLAKDKDIRITQRIRLEQSKLDGVQKRISASTSHAIFLGLAGSTSFITVDEDRVQTRSLRNLVSYLKQKVAAGVTSLLNEEKTEAIGVLYAFPPCEFATELLKKSCNSLSKDVLKEDHLVIVVVREAIV